MWWRAYCGPAHREYWRRWGLHPGLRCLDLGCGGGGGTFQLAAAVGPQGQVIGVGMDENKIDLARQSAKRMGLGNVQFRNLNVQDWIEETQYDCIYCRFPPHPSSGSDSSASADIAGCPDWRGSYRGRH